MQHFIELKRRDIQRADGLTQPIAVFLDSIMYIEPILDDKHTLLVFKAPIRSMEDNSIIIVEEYEDVLDKLVAMTHNRTQNIRIVTEEG